MEITDAKYQELLGDQQKVKSLENENDKLKETAENTKIALKTNREEINSLKTDKSTIEDEFWTFKSESEESLKKLEWFEDIEKNANSWTEYQTSIYEARSTKIEEMKTKLWEDFLKTHEGFLDWLPEDKVETFLTPYIDSLDPPDVDVWTSESWVKSDVWTKHSTKFDEAIGKWDAIAALAEIPAPQ